MEFDFAEAGACDVAKRGQDLGLALFGGIKKRVLRRTANAVVMAGRERFIPPGPGQHSARVVVWFEMVHQEKEDVDRTPRDWRGCDHPAHIIADEVCVSARVEANAEGGG